MTPEKRELSIPGRIFVTILAIAQIAFAFLAAWDLWLRPAKLVRGPKPAWAPVLLVNWIGPAAYFVFGIRHDKR